MVAGLSLPGPTGSFANAFRIGRGDPFLCRTLVSKLQHGALIRLQLKTRICECTDDVHHIQFAQCKNHTSKQSTSPDKILSSRLLLETLLPLLLSLEKFPLLE